jgi:glycosyltransferase involved in cell wall biosynthesis
MEDNARKLPISCYIRTLNEADRLAPVILAALEVAEEVIVIDSGSQDRTVEVAASLGARVIHQPWLGNGKQKRVGEDACKHDWLLDLDADEVLTDGLIAEIKNAFAQGRPKFEIYKLTLVFVPPQSKPWLNFNLSKRAKLYNKNSFRMPDSALWDQLEIPANVLVGRFSAPILHYSFRSIEDMVSKMNRVSTARSKGKKPVSAPFLALRIIFGFPLYFLKNYVVKGMFRGGLYGFCIASLGAGGRWLTDVKNLERSLKKS